MGMAIAVPRELLPVDLEQLFRWMEAEPGYHFVHLTMGNLGECSLELDTRSETDRPYTLRPSTYTGPVTGLSGAVSLPMSWCSCSWA